MLNDWQKAQQWEAQWHGNCANTYGEETKQLLYARKMGLSFFHDGKSPYNIDMKGKSVLDIGGGPGSLLLKCIRNGAEIQCDLLRGMCVSDGCDCRTPPYDKFVLIDPMPMPQWVIDRYSSVGIEVLRIKAEEIHLPIDGPISHLGNGVGGVYFPEGVCGFDEVWIYNVLQHVNDPQNVIANAKKAGRLIRIFEWIGTPANVGHPHTLTEEKLNEWLGGEGKVEILKGENTCSGKCYYGIFPT